MMRDLPTGEDPAAYRVHQSANAWRWEFLRRRADYRDDWSRFHVEWLEKKLPECKSRPLPKGVRSWKSHFKDIAEMPNYAQREKYAVSHLVNPALEWDPYRFLGVLLSEPEHICAQARRSTPPELHAYERRFEAFYLEYWARQNALKEAGIVTAHIDLKQSLERQLAYIKVWTKKAQAELPKHGAVSQRRWSLWATYLRMLDLDRLGVSLRDIAAACIQKPATVGRIIRSRRRFALHSNRRSTSRKLSRSAAEKICRIEILSLSRLHLLARCCQVRNVARIRSITGDCDGSSAYATGLQVRAEGTHGLGRYLASRKRKARPHPSGKDGPRR